MRQEPERAELLQMARPKRLAPVAVPQEKVMVLVVVKEAASLGADRAGGGGDVGGAMTVKLLGEE